MDFFAAQDQARKQTAWLVVFYVMAVVGIIVAVYLVFAFIFVSSAESEIGESLSLWDPQLFIWITLCVGTLIVGASFFKTMQLSSSGGAAVARSLGGRPVDPGTRDADERKLLNVVEEMALAAGTVVPQVYLLDDEPGINAFAAGFSQRDAVIGVTRGCVERLTRDELQGVVAHEFSHIVNGDMRLNLRLMGILFGIMMLTVIGQILLRTVWLSGGSRSRSNKKEGGNPLPFIGLALIIIGYIGVFFASLIKSAVSRQREFLSDASAVQYTRNPSGIASALKKIGGLEQGARVRNVHAAEASHLFFGEALGRGLTGLFATHPPLATRIKRLDPQFNPEIEKMMKGGTSGGSAGVPGMAGFAQSNAGKIDVATAANLIGSIPAPVMEAAHSPVGARSLVYALLWSEDTASEVRIRQEEALQLDPQARDEAARLREVLLKVGRETRLPLAELAVPSLRRMPPEQYARFRNTVQALTEADSKIDLFEFALSQMIIRHVEPAFGKISTAPIKYRTPEKVAPACSAILAALAVWGTEKPDAAASCYAAGCARFGAKLPSLDPHISLSDVATALKTLAAAAPAVKKQVLDACSAVVTADGKIALEQQELLRAMADAMDVPLPPLSVA